MIRGAWPGARSVREVASALAGPTWPGEVRRTLALPPGMRQEHSDVILFLITIGLLGFGLTMVFSTGVFTGQFTGAGPYDRLVKQGFRGLVGLGLLLLASRVDYRRWARLSPWLAIGTLALLVAVFVPGLGHVSKGAQRWLSIGPIKIQPTEFARIGLILYLARILARPPERIERFATGPLPALLVVGLFMGLIALQPSLGSAVALALTGVILCVTAGMRWKHFLALAVPALLLALLAVLGSEVFHAYQSDRIHSWIAMWRGQDDPLRDTYQLRQSIVALGSGGLTGKGLGAGQQKWFFLPDAHTDFIYAIIGEETGLAGAFGVLIAFALLVWRGLRIAAEAEDRYGYLLASGITINFAVYAAINLAVTMGLLPTTGLPLPLISYGGSALIANMVAVGLLLSVSRRRSGAIVLSGRVRRRSS